MKIEQRIGRVDRIGQQRDVEVYNFILADTVESRVKGVLEEKLAVILKEIGIDKYADVLDSETAGVNFTDAYMNSIRSPKSVEYILNH
jgi:SNF2 family DNA or RNA helicase